MLVIVYEKKGEGIRFWTGSTWQRDFPEAAKYESLSDAVAVIEDNSRVANKWTKVIANYGTDAEHVARVRKLSDPLI